MKVAVIADIHDNLTNLEKCLDFCLENNIEKMICCGDVTNSETLKYMADNFSGEIFLVRGNMEIYEEEEAGQYNNINYLGRIGHADIAEKTIGMCHEPFLLDKVLEEKECDMVFYGHTHQPWEEARKGTRIINPGTLGGVFSKPTYAVWNTETDEMEMQFIS
jgi:hypothetical protein